MAKNKRSKSVVGYMGGKTKLSPTIIACMPPHRAYVEVFCGSAVVFFNKPPRTSKLEVINDINGELVNLMKVISGTHFDESIRQEFIGYVRSMPASREVFEDWKKWDEEKLRSLTPAQRAFRFYYCVKNGFSSTPTCGYAASPFTPNRYNMETDFESFSARFREKGAQIEHMDFASLIEKYNRPEANSFFFMDPPYFVADDTNYYEFKFDTEKHQKLKDCCDQIQSIGNKFLITYDDVPEVISLYADYYIYRTDPILYQSGDERGERDNEKSELFVANYDVHKVLNSADMFEDSKDNKIDIPNCIGLTRIQVGK